MTVNRVLFCMEYTGLYCQELREWLEREGIVYGMRFAIYDLRFTI
jgi:hypothetical protein